MRRHKGARGRRRQWLTCRPSPIRSRDGAVAKVVGIRGWRNCPASQNRRWSAGGDHAMTRDITLPAAGPSETMVFEGEGWFDPLEDAVRGKVRTFIEAILEEELEASLSRKRYERHGDGRAPAAVAGHRHGHR